MQQTLPKLLIVDDDPEYLTGFERVLRRDFRVLQAQDAASARHLFSQGVDIALLDIRLNNTAPYDQEGIELLTEFHSAKADLPIVMISAYGDINTAVNCMKIGASDFIQKTSPIMEIRHRLLHTYEHSRIVSKAKQMEERLATLEPSEIVFSSPSMERVKELTQMVAQDGYATVLIQGETGTGKELVARAIHRLGWRSNDPFVAVAIPSLNPNLIESELFGHEAGAFTDAKARRIGLIEKVGRGVLFLDEIGDLPLNIQTKLLRFLETKKFMRVGSGEEIDTDIQILTATNQNIEKAVQSGQIRRDLFFRLKSVVISLPPLRERREDIPLLSRYFLGILQKQRRTHIKTISNEAIDNLINYRWPGNVRELRAVIERGTIYANYHNHLEITPDDLPYEITQTAQRKATTSSAREREGNISFDLDLELARFELRFIEKALLRSEGKKTETWRLLGLNNRFSLRRRVLKAFAKYPFLREQYPMISNLYRLS